MEKKTLEQSHLWGNLWYNQEKTLTKIIKKEEALKIIKENDLYSYDFFKNHNYCEKEFLDLEFIDTQSRTYVRYAELNLRCSPLFKKTIQIEKGFFGDKKVEIKENTGYYIIYDDYELNIFFLIEKDFVKDKNEHRLSIIKKYF